MVKTPNLIFEYGNIRNSWTLNIKNETGIAFLVGIIFVGIIIIILTIFIIACLRRRYLLKKKGLSDEKKIENEIRN